MTVARDLELEIGGMTCASCANRIERKLNRMPGVEASVNYATEKARVFLPAELGAEDAIATVEAAGYTAVVPAPLVAVQVADPETEAEAEADDGDTAEVRSLRQRLLVSAVLAVPVVVLSMVPSLQFANWQWLVLTLAAPVAVWGAWPFHRAAWVNARHGAATMDTLISVGVLAALGWSLYALFFGSAGMTGMTMSFELFPATGSGADHIYLEVAAVVPVFILAGRYFEARAKRNSSAALRALLHMGAKEATVLRDGREVLVPVAELAIGDEFTVRPGEKVATDGVVAKGSSAIDASMISGESMPVEVSEGDSVIGSTVNVHGHLTVRVTRVGADTELARMARLVEEAQTGKADVQRLADRVSAVFVPIVIGLAILTLAGWLIAGAGAEIAFSAAVATLIIACPCALGLATPTALLVGTGRGSQLGILIRGPQILESTRRVDTVVLDKTGTVTTGEMTLTDVRTNGMDEEEFLGLLAAVEHPSEHPIARAIVKGATEHELTLPEVESFRSEQGLGVQAVVAGRLVAVGRLSWLNESWGLELGALQEAADEAERSGATVVAAGWDGTVHGIAIISDRIKLTATQSVRAFEQLGLRTVLLTGDNERAAATIAREVGIGEVIAGVLPAGKLDAIHDLQRQGRVVAMIGDGVNDAAALAAADLGIAMGSGTDAAIEAADITLMNDDLLSAVDSLRLARRTLGTIKGNLFWAFAYNTAAIPLAMAGLLNPLLAGAAMALSSVFVVSNSLRLRGFQPTPKSG